MTGSYKLHTVTMGVVIAFCYGIRSVSPTSLHHFFTHCLFWKQTNKQTKNALKKSTIVLIWKIIFFLIYVFFYFQTCHLYLDTGSNIYLVELLVRHMASISSLPVCMIWAAVTFQHVEKVFPDRWFSLILFWNHFVHMLKRLDYRKDALNYNRINFFNNHNWHPTHVFFCMSKQMVSENNICYGACNVNDRNKRKHRYSDVIMSTTASQITGVSFVYSTVCSGIDQRKHQSSASLAFVRGIHRSPVNSPHKGQ